MNTQEWSPLGWTAWISLQSKGISRVFSNTTVQKHQCFGAKLSLQSNSHSCFIRYSKAKFSCYSRCVLTSYFYIPVPYNEKYIFFGC